MFEEIKHILELTDESSQRMVPPSEIYNENWLLRLTMFWFSKQKSFIINSDSDRIILKAFKFYDKARFYTNGTIETPFRKRNKEVKDPLAEPNSDVSAILGHFMVKYGKKREKVILKPDASQFVIIQAMLFDELSKGIKCASNYNQVARTIACMIYNINTLENKTLDNLGYYVIVPTSQLSIDSFKNYTYKKDIVTKIKNRVEQYGDEFTKSTWFSNFNLIFQRIEVECLAWEDILRFIIKNDNEYGNKLDIFYQK
ncbi:MAG: hypothetical protein K0Q49_1449, partial [Haloplasmataceae bacterium]|nr:hypothetical protein [Haloplasmataceae bacterium]